MNIDGSLPMVELTTGNSSLALFLGQLSVSSKLQHQLWTYLFPPTGFVTSITNVLGTLQTKGNRAETLVACHSSQIMSFCRANTILNIFKSR